MWRLGRVNVSFIVCGQNTADWAQVKPFWSQLRGHTRLAVVFQAAAVRTELRPKAVHVLYTLSKVMERATRLSELLEWLETIKFNYFSSFFFFFF